VIVPAVKSGDAWLGRYIGIELASAIGLFDNLAGGYWDVDNVRLEIFQNPRLTPISHGKGQFTLHLEGDPGPYEILASTDVALALSNWNNLGTVTNQGGSVSFTDTNAILGRRFYQARPAQ